MTIVVGLCCLAEHKNVRSLRTADHTMKRTTPTVTTTALSVVAAATMAWGLTACGNDAAEPTNTAVTSASTTSASATMTADTTTAPPERAPEELTQREKAARLMMVGVKNYDDARAALKNGAGGIFIGSWTDPALLTSQDRNIAALRAEIGRPFAVSIDAEGGRVQRQPALFGSVPSPREMAATMKPEQVTGVARDLGTKLRERGITMDFAPVLDVDGGSANGAIGDRSFSGDPAIAATYATACGKRVLNLCTNISLVTAAPQVILTSRPPALRRWRA